MTQVAFRRASAPARICLVGEDLDWLGGTSIQAAIDLRVTVDCVWAPAPCRFTMSTTGVMNSHLEMPDVWTTPEAMWARFITACATFKLRREDPLWPTEVKVWSDVPAAAGVGSSAALCVAGVAASTGISDFGRLSRESWFVEHEVLSRDVGAMDYLPCIAGGVIEASCSSEGVDRTAKLHWPEKARLLLLDTRLKRNTSDVILWKRSRRSGGDPSISRYISKTRKLAALLSRLLSRPDADVSNIGSVVTEAHVSLRDDMGVSNKLIEECVHRLLLSGAAGAKITGTGRGGCVFAVVDKTDMERVLAAVQEMPVNATEVGVESDGIRLR